METTHSSNPIPTAIPAPLPEGGAGGGCAPAPSPTQPPPLHASAASSLSSFPLPFHPTQEAADDILAAYVDPDQTLAEIARRFKVSIRALACWLNHPDTLRHINDLQEATSRRAKFIAAANQRLALNLLISIIEGHLDAEANVPVNTQSLKAVAQRDRARATARLAASQLIRLSNGPGHTDHQPTSPSTPAPSPAHLIPSAPPHVPSKITHTIETPPSSLSSTPQPTTQTATVGQAVSSAQSLLHALPCNAALHNASCTNEAG